MEGMNNNNNNGNKNVGVFLLVWLSSQEDFVMVTPLIAARPKAVACSNASLIALRSFSWMSS